MSGSVFHAVKLIGCFFPALCIPLLHFLVRRLTGDSRIGLLAALCGGARRGGPQRSTDLYRRLLARLRRRGHDKKVSDTALEFLRSVERLGDAEEASVTREVTHRYLQARFGDRPLTAQEEAYLATRVKKLTTRPRMPAP